MKQKLCLLLALLLALSQFAAAVLAEEAPAVDTGDSDIFVQLLSRGEQPEITYEELVRGYWLTSVGNDTGKLIEQEGISAKRTNIIPVTPGDQLAYKGKGSSAVPSVVWLDEKMRYLSDQKMASTEEYSLAVAPDKAFYAWFESYEYSEKIEKVVLEVKWMICQAAESRYDDTNYFTILQNYEARFEEMEGTIDDLIALVTRLSQSDALYGKKIIYDGDSIVAGASEKVTAYPQLIAEMTGGHYESLADGGAHLCKNDKYASVVENLKNLPKDGDLYCFQGGINDFWSATPIGQCDPTDYKSEPDPTTICGALETIFRYCLENLPGKPVCFVITHKVQKTSYKPNEGGDTFADYRNAMIAVCEKYSIPYYDAFNESGLNGWNSTQDGLFLTGESGKGDGLHPNTDGYKHFYVPQLLDLFRRIMPVE